MKFETIKTSVVRFLKDEDGLTIVEYAVAGGLVTIGAVAAFLALGNTVCGAINSLTDAILGIETPIAACA